MMMDLIIYVNNPGESAIDGFALWSYQISEA
jgi:hypothetical protein